MTTRADDADAGVMKGEDVVSVTMEVETVLASSVARGVLRGDANAKKARSSLSSMCVTNVVSSIVSTNPSFFLRLFVGTLRSDLDVQTR